jgi:hypothetical protein
MSIHRLQTQGFRPPTPVKGEAAPVIATPAGVSAPEVVAQQAVKAVAVDVLDAFLSGKVARPSDRGAFPSLARLTQAFGTQAAPSTSTRAAALSQTLQGVVEGLERIYADGRVTEGELGQLHGLSGQMNAVLGLADPTVLNLLPKAVREKVQNQLLEPLTLLQQAASRRAGRVFDDIDVRDRGALVERLQEPVSYGAVDVAACQQAGVALSSSRRYRLGDFIAVPRSSGAHQQGVVVGRDDDGKLRVELFDARHASLGVKSLDDAEVARANPLKVGDYLAHNGAELWVTGVSDRGVVGVVKDRDGRTHNVDATTIEQWATAATAPKPRTSRQSLEAALDVIWNDRASFLRGDKSVYSSVYNAVSEVNTLTQPKAQFLGDLKALAAARPASSTSNTQCFGGNGDSMGSMVDAWQAGQLPENGPYSASRFEGTFFRFERAHWQPEKITQRVYLNAASDHATALMRFVVQQIVDNPAQFPGVEMAKLSGPTAVGSRSENIVIYTHGDDASRRVLSAIAQYKAQHPSHFMTGVPAFTACVSGGVAIGDEPRAQGESFGSVRSTAIEHALHQAQGLDRADFGRLVDQALLQRSVDPQHPHRNQPHHQPSTSTTPGPRPGGP